MGVGGGGDRDRRALRRGVGWVGVGCAAGGGGDRDRRRRPAFCGVGVGARVRAGDESDRRPLRADALLAEADQAVAADATRDRGDGFLVGVFWGVFAGVRGLAGRG